MRLACGPCHGLAKEFSLEEFALDETTALKWKEARLGGLGWSGTRTPIRIWGIVIAILRIFLGTFSENNPYLIPAATDYIVLLPHDELSSIQHLML